MLPPRIGGSIVPTHSSLFGNPVQLFIERFSGFQPDRAPRIVDIFVGASLSCFSRCHSDATLCPEPLVP
jgi:hypothetical protein